MSTGTTLVLYKQALVTALQARGGLAGTQITYEYPFANITGRDIWLGKALAETHVPTMRAGVKKLDEEYTVLIVAQVLATEGQGQEYADTQAVTLLQEIQQQFATTPQLIPEIMWATLTGWEHNLGVFGHDDTGGQASRGSRFEIISTVRARLG